MLHALGLAMLASWQFSQDGPAARAPAVIELIEIPIVDILPEPEAEPVIEPEPDVPADDPPEQSRQVETEEEETDTPAPEPETAQPEASPEVALASGTVAVETGSTDQPSEEPEEQAPEIDPRYVIQYDPFTEAPPTALSRVSRAINCGARETGATRPSLLPYL